MKESIIESIQNGPKGIYDYLAPILDHSTNKKDLKASYKLFTQIIREIPLDLLEATIKLHPDLLEKVFDKEYSSTFFYSRSVADRFYNGNFKYFKRLTNIGSKNGPIDGVDKKTIAMAIRYKLLLPGSFDLRNLDLSIDGTNPNSAIYESGAKKLAKALKESPKLETLNLSGNKIGSDGLRKLLAAVKGKDFSDFKTLNLSGNEITNSGVEALGNLGFVNLETLDLSNNYIEAAGVEKLTEVLGNLPNLTTLNLSNNKVGDRGTIALAKALENLPKLTKLVMPNKTIGGAGKKALLMAQLKINEARRVEREILARDYPADLLIEGLPEFRNEEPTLLTEQEKKGIRVKVQVEMIKKNPDNKNLVSGMLEDLRGAEGAEIGYILTQLESPECDGIFRAIVVELLENHQDLTKKTLEYLTHSKDIFEKFITIAGDETIKTSSPKIISFALSLKKPDIIEKLLNGLEIAEDQLGVFLVIAMIENNQDYKNLILNEINSQTALSKYEILEKELEFLDKSIENKKFECAINHSFISDPVVIKGCPTHGSYEKTAIEEALSISQRNPLTRQEASLKDVVQPSEEYMREHDRFIFVIKSLPAVMRRILNDFEPNKTESIFKKLLEKAKSYTENDNELYPEGVLEKLEEDFNNYSKPETKLQGGATSNQMSQGSEGNQR